MVRVRRIQCAVAIIGISGAIYLINSMSNFPTGYFRQADVLKTRLSKTSSQSGASCSCAFDVPVNSELDYNSYCSNKSTNVGLNQRVLAFSLYSIANSTSDYMKFVKARIDDVTALYPGWRFRLYMPPAALTADLCPVICNSKIVDICFVDRIPILGDVQDITAMTWRFLPLGDPTVEVFGSRDLDSPILEREVDAVNQWMESGKMFHTMRDNRFHNTGMLGGMWGARNYGAGTNYSERTSKFRDHFVNHKVRNPFQKQTDQALLQKLVYRNLTSKDLMEHDSYLCKSYTDAIPFPTQRKPHGGYVGGFVGVEAAVCPEECRPENHKDWEHC